MVARREAPEARLFALLQLQATNSRAISSTTLNEAKKDQKTHKRARRTQEEVNGDVLTELFEIDDFAVSLASHGWIPPKYYQSHANFGHLEDLFRQFIPPEELGGP